MLDAWLLEAANAAGARDVDLGLLGRDAIELLLDLAKEAAHGVARPGAPLATFAVGLAVGQSGGGLGDLSERVSRVMAAAQGHAQDAGRGRVGAPTEPHSSAG